MQFLVIKVGDTNSYYWGQRINVYWKLVQIFTVQSGNDETDLQVTVLVWAHIDLIERFLKQKLRSRFCVELLQTCCCHNEFYVFNRVRHRTRPYTLSIHRLSKGRKFEICTWPNVGIIKEPNFLFLSVHDAVHLW